MKEANETAAAVADNGDEKLKDEALDAILSEYVYYEIADARVLRFVTRVDIKSVYHSQ